MGLNRFLIRRGVVCRNLASHVLGRALRRLSGAFETRCAYRPYQVEPFVEHPRHSGVSLQASNWRYVGETSGRGRQDRGHAAQETTKAIHLYALDADWRARLRLGPAPSPSDVPLAPTEGLDAEHWAEHAFGSAPLGDQRRSRRLVDCAKRQAEEPMRALTCTQRRLLHQPGIATERYTDA